MKVGMGYTWVPQKIQELLQGQQDYDRFIPERFIQKQVEKMAWNCERDLFERDYLQTIQFMYDLNYFFCV